MELIKCAKELLIRQPFYGLFLLNLRKEIVDDNHFVKTAAVGPNGINFTLYVNNTFWKELTDLQQLAVLQHELMHICFMHLTDDYKCDNPYNMNIAMDCAINQFIDNLPPNCVTLQGLSAKLGKKLEAKRGAWYYYKEIQDFAEKNPDKCVGGFGAGEYEDIDDHSMWPTDISEAERKLYENQIKSKLKETAEYVAKQAGNIPGELSEILQNIKEKPPVFNWKKYFRRLVGNAITNDIQLTRMRPSKRFPDARGLRFKRKPVILVGVDTSGSIGTKDLEDFFSEINHIYKSGVSVTVAECDTQIQNIFKYEGKKDINISGRGGTELSPVIDYYKEHKEFTVCILFTDGYCNTQLQNCQNLIWVITSDGNKSQTYTPGKVVFIP